MRLYLRPNSNYWQYEIRGPRGKIRKSSGTTLKKEARRIAEYQQQKVYKQIFLDEKSCVTVSQAIELFLKEKQITKPTTYEQYKHLCNMLLRYLKPNMSFETITTMDVLRIQRNTDYAPKTTNHMLGLLNSMRLCADDWDVQVPTFKYKRLKISHKLRFISYTEELKITDKLSFIDQRDICTILLDTGMRISELVSLLISDIDLENNSLTIYRSKTDNIGKLGVTKRMRTILHRRISESKSPYLFPSPRDLTKPRTTTTKSIRRAIKAAGLNSPENVARYGTCTVHSFRDTFATRLVQAGVSLFKVQVMLGHSSPQMTQKYAHLQSDDIYDEVADVLNRGNYEHT